MQNGQINVWLFELSHYHSDPKYLIGQVWANNVDPEEAVWSEYTLFAIPTASVW